MLVFMMTRLKAILQVHTTAINFSFLLSKARRSRAEQNMQLNLQRKQINEPKVLTDKHKLNRILKLTTKYIN